MSREDGKRFSALLPQTFKVMSFQKKKGKVGPFTSMISMVSLPTILITDGYHSETFFYTAQQQKYEKC